MTQLLTDLSDSLAATVEKAGQGVARVEGRRRLHASGTIWSADGVIVTAHHVIEREEGIRVGLPSGQVVSAALVGRDPTTDIAVLRAEASGLAVLQWTPPDNLNVGHLVLALGRPGETVRATLSIVSALGSSWVSPAGGRLDRYLQSDTVMYPGFSGGPLVDVSGRVLGINSSALLRGLSITVPYPTVKRVVETLLAQGTIRRSYLGVGTQPARLPSALAQQLGQETGLLVVAVAPDSPAEQAGMFLGDIIVAFNEQPVRFIDDLLTALSDVQVGATATVRIVRGGQLRDLSVTVGAQP